MRPLKIKKSAIAISELKGILVPVNSAIDSSKNGNPSVTGFNPGTP